MKKIEAIIRSSKFEAVKQALGDIGVNFFTFYEVKGYGKQKGDHVVYRGAEYDIGYIARLKIELIVSDEVVDQVVETISGSAKTGEIGDGKILVLPIETVNRIRTGETDLDAI